MRRLFSTKKRIAVLVASGAVVLAAGGIAAAFFTAGGTGSGTATVGSSANFKITTSAATGGPLYPDQCGGIVCASPPYPGTNVETIPYTVQNVNSVHQTLTSLLISVANPDGSAWTSQANLGKPQCNASDFSVGGAAVGTAYSETSPVIIGPYNAGVSASYSVTIEMIDNGANQDNCQGVTVPLYFVASGTLP